MFWFQSRCYLGIDLADQWVNDCVNFTLWSIVFKISKIEMLLSGGNKVFELKIVAAFSFYVWQKIVINQLIKIEIFKKIDKKNIIEPKDKDSALQLTIIYLIKIEKFNWQSNIKFM